MSAKTEILLIEDDPDDLELTLRAFHDARLADHVWVAHDGAEALAYLFGRDGDAMLEAQSLPRVILMDLRLPKVDGFDVLRRIKRDARTRSIPVVILTASKEQRDLIEGYKLGVISYIVKPTDFHGLSAAIRELDRYWLQLNEQPP